ncbi:MAG: hypothetical protein WBB65_12180 [Anaerolineales bacterium]
MKANGTGVLMPMKRDDQRWLAGEFKQDGDLRPILYRVDLEEEGLENNPLFLLSFSVNQSAINTVQRIWFTLRKISS